MSSILRIPFNNGYVSSGTGARDAADLEVGELQEFSGGYYRKNDPLQAWTMPGRSLFGVAGSGAIKGVAVCLFDEGGTDKLVASVGTTLVAATPGATGTFASLVTGLSSESTHFTACHQDDRWYLGNGYDTNRCLKPDGTVRLMSMQRPATAPTCVPSAGALVTARPTAEAGGWTEGLGFSAYDTYESTYALGEVNIAYRTVLGTPASLVNTWSGFASDTGLNRRLSVIFDLVSIYCTSVNTSKLVVEYSQDSGATWSELYSRLFYGAPTGNQTVTVPISVNSNLIQIRATITPPGTQVIPGVNGGTYSRQSHVLARMFDIRIQGGGIATNFSTIAGGGMYYAIAEYDANDDRLSPLSITSEVVTMSSQNFVTVTRGAIANPAATHWYVYRTVDGVADNVENFGRVSEDIPVSVSTWIDPFDILSTEQASPTIPLVAVGDTYYNRDDPAPSFFNIASWRGSLCGLSRDNRRSWFYSDLGRPESWPVIYQVISFPLDEHDVLIGQMAVGETMILLCNGAVLAIDDAPRVTDGVFNPGSARALRGHPGCVGEYAYTPWSVAGEPRGAWVSPFGVYVTNGQVSACISEDLAWEREVNVSYLSTAVLKWDAKNLILWFEFDKDGDGLNDREMPFHMAQAHEKGNGRPKLGQPTAKATSCMASALIDSAHYRFSGHPSDGSVYVEETGRVDAATAETVTMRLRSGQVSRNKVTLGVIKATVNHSDFGSGETGTLTATTYHDTTNWQDSVEQSVALNGNRGTTVGVGRAGELVDFTFEYDGTATGGVGGVTAEIDGMGRSGSAPRVTSNSATP